MCGLNVLGANRVRMGPKDFHSRQPGREIPTPQRSVYGPDGRCWSVLYSLG